VTPFASRLRELSRAASKGPWDYSPRPNDRPDEAPGSIITGAATGRATAVVVSPRYVREQFAVDAALIVALRNRAERIADVVDAVAAYRAARADGPVLSRTALERMFAALDALDGDGGGG
jgi:hypothetical protein